MNKYAIRLGFQAITLAAMVAAEIALIAGAAARAH
jgi:hypothetical protein